jgi:hypothetical protein
MCMEISKGFKTWIIVGPYNCGSVCCVVCDDHLTWRQFLLGSVDEELRRFVHVVRCNSQFLIALLARSFVASRPMFLLSLVVLLTIAVCCRVI